LIISSHSPSFIPQRVAKSACATHFCDHQGSVKLRYPWI
jgi:hypothetical protein